MEKRPINIKTGKLARFFRRENRKIEGR